MDYPREDRIIIAISSSALFDLGESDKVFRERGEIEYRSWMGIHRDEAFRPGMAFPFVRKFLTLNSGFGAGQGPVEVVLLSRNDPEAGIRVFKSIEHYGFDISRAAFLNGHSPFPYIQAFGASLFLSANAADVREAVVAGLPAGTIVSAGFPEEDGSGELRVAFDFDGVLAGDEAERAYRQSGSIEAFIEEESKNADKPLDPGPLKGFFTKLATVQKFQRLQKYEGIRTMIRTAIITARNAPAHERLINTLASWGMFTDEVFFLGGMEKRRILEVYRPHIFFDDQMLHLESSTGPTACVHVPFGIANRGNE
jgi:5'-nucleotidase